MWQDVEAAIEQYRNFLLTTHIHPDGDGIGSACALSELLLARGKKVRFVCDSPIPNKFRFLDYHGTFEEYLGPNHYNEVDCLVVLDAHKLDRIGAVAEVVKRPGVTSLCLDHHHASNPFTPLGVIDPSACSVGAMIYTLYQDFQLPLNLRAANGIYTSIFCDTGRFSYASTTHRAHRIAQECIQLGVDPDVMYNRLFQQLSMSQLQIFARVLQQMEAHCKNRLLVQTLRLSDVADMNITAEEVEELDLEYILEFDRLVAKVDCVVLLREVGGGNIRVSIRTKAHVDVTHVMERLGGGGHSHAAGALVEGTVEQVKERVIQEVTPLLISSSPAHLPELNV